LCKHNKGWHERHERHTNYPSHLTKPTNLTTSTNYKVLETIKYMSLCINRIISVLIKNIFFHFQRAQNNFDDDYQIDINDFIEVKPKLLNLYNSKFDIRNTALQYNIGSKKVKKSNNKPLFEATVIFLPEKDNFKIPRNGAR